MKGRIDKHGNLVIVRGGEEVHQICRPGNGGLSSCLPHCRHDCSLFGEPEWEMDEGIPTGRTLLQICKRTLTFDEFVDERGRK